MSATSTVPIVRESVGWSIVLSVLMIIAAILPALVWRLLDEERFLASNLPGYTAYQGRVRYRLLPLVW